MAKKISPEAAAKPQGSGGPDPDKVRDFASRIGAAKQELDEVRGTHNEIFKEVEDAGIHKAAFKAALKLHGMEDAKAQEWLREFDSYCHIFGVHDQGKLDLAAE